MYFFGNNSGTVADASQLQTKWLTQIHTRAQVFGESWTWMPSARWVNEARFGYNRLYQPTFTSDHNANIQQYRPGYRSNQPALRRTAAHQRFSRLHFPAGTGRL